LVDQIGRALTGTANPLQGDKLDAENLGYVPGQDMGVAFMQGKVASAALVIELAAAPDTVRWWAEQMTAQASDKPLIVAASAAVEPMSRPYYEGARSNGQRQITGLLASVPDAAAYQFKLDRAVAERERILSSAASIGLANAALVVLMMVGALIQLIGGGAGRARTAAGGKRR
jgi:hypothetical protein